MCVLFSDAILLFENVAADQTISLEFCWVLGLGSELRFIWSLGLVYGYGLKQQNKKYMDLKKIRKNIFIKYLNINKIFLEYKNSTCIEW